MNRPIWTRLAGQGLDEKGPSRHKRDSLGGQAITLEVATGGRHAAPVLSLLFDAASRPDARAVRALAESGEFSITFDASSGRGGAKHGDWMELSLNGLTFDLRGLAPGEPGMLLLHPRRFGLLPSLSHCEAVTLAPTPHLAGGEGTSLVLRAQLLLGVLLCALPGLAAVCWLPARSLTGTALFREATLGWLAGRVVPDFLQEEMPA